MSVFKAAFTRGASPINPETIVTNNKLTLSVSGQADLTYFITPGQNYTIEITGEEGLARKGKLSVLTMSCTATNSAGVTLPVCYNFDAGKTNTSLATDIAKIEWIGESCGTTADKINLRIKTTFQYSVPGEYNIIDVFCTLRSPGEDPVGWLISPTADTVINITDESVSRRLGKPFTLKITCRALDPFNNEAFICYNISDGIYRGDTLKTDNPKIEFIGWKCSVDK